MTIFFVTNGDAATEANFNVANGMEAPGDIVLFGANATRAHLYLAVEANGNCDSIFSMSHGDLDGTFDSIDGLALGAEDAASFAGFKIFAWACFTGARLGATFSKSNAIWWGYDCVLTAPDDRVEYAPLFRRILQVAKSSFRNGIDHASALIVIEAIKLECLAAIDELDIATLGQPGAIPLYSCCNQAWQRLSVWLPGNDVPIKHSDAPAAFLNI